MNKVLAFSLGLRLFCSLVCCTYSGLSSAATDPAAREAEPDQDYSSTNLKGRGLGYCLV